MAMGHFIRRDMPSLAALVQTGREYFGKEKPEPVEDAEALLYKSILDRELDQQHLTPAEREDCNALHAVRSALYGGD
jgi:hypothetical protein